MLRVSLRISAKFDRARLKEGLAKISSQGAIVTQLRSTNALVSS
jgi:hypothetical protein